MAVEPDPGTFEWSEWCYVEYLASGLIDDEAEAAARDGGRVTDDADLPSAALDVILNGAPVAMRATHIGETVELGAVLVVDDDRGLRSVGLAGVELVAPAGIVRALPLAGSLVTSSVIDGVRRRVVVDLVRVSEGSEVITRILAAGLVHGVPVDGTLVEWDHPRPVGFRSCAACARPPYDSPWVGHRHKAVHVPASGPGAPRSGACIDGALVAAVAALWRHGVRVVAACQGDPPDYQDPTPLLTDLTGLTGSWFVAPPDGYLRLADRSDVDRLVAGLAADQRTTGRWYVPGVRHRVDIEVDDDTTELGPGTGEALVSFPGAATSALTRAIARAFR
jgi:hypothetical protein